MTFLDGTNPQVREAVRRIRALRELTKQTRVLTYRTQNEILASLPGDVLAAVAVELNELGEQSNERPKPRQ